MYPVGTGTAILIIINIVCIMLYVVNKWRQRREDSEIKRHSDDTMLY